MLSLSLLLNKWAFIPEAWLILGILLVLSDLFIGMSYFLLPIGLSAFLTALVVKIESNIEVDMEQAIVLLDNWHDVMYWFAGFSLIFTIAMRLFFKKTSTGHDINDY